MVNDDDDYKFFNSSVVYVMKIIPRKDVGCLIYSSLKGKERANQYNSIINDFGHFEVRKRISKLQKRGFIDNNEKITNDGKLALELLDM